MVSAGSHLSWTVVSAGSKMSQTVFSRKSDMTNNLGRKQKLLD